MTNSLTSQGRLIPLTKWPEFHPEGPTVGALRHYVFYSERFNFSEVVKRLGKRLYIDEAAYYRWATSRGLRESR